MKFFFCQIKKDQRGLGALENLIIFLLVANFVLGVIDVTGAAAHFRDVKRQADIKDTEMALVLYRMDNNHFPVYQGNDPEQSWQTLTSELEDGYAISLSDDPAYNMNYSYWSDGQTAKLVYYSEAEQTVKEYQLDK